MPDVPAANDYDASGCVILSSSPQIGGQTFTDIDELAGTPTGELVSETGIVGATEKEGHPNLADRHLSVRFMETYMPITKGGASPVTGVVETYKARLALQRAAADGLRRLWPAAACSCSAR